MLNDLPAQHALLLLRSSMQGLLRHLMRTLPPTPKVVDMWRTLDRHLLRAVLRLRGACTESRALDTLLVGLPVSMGGFGILPHAELAEHAYAAMAESADLLLSSVLPGYDAPVAPALLKQRDRCQPVLEERRKQALALMSAEQRLCYADNLAPLNSQPLFVVPHTDYLHLSNREMATLVHYRTLVPGSHGACRWCLQPDNLGHAEVCRSGTVLYTARHEGAKKAIGWHVATVEGNEVRREISVLGGEKRTDLRITGPASYLTASSDYDVSIVSVFQKTLKLPAGDVTDVVAANKAAILALLDARAEKKVIKYRGSTPQSFHPVILSVGGTLSTSTARVFDHWRESMPLATYHSMLRNLGVSLLRYRGRVFQL